MAIFYIYAFKKQQTHTMRFIPLRKDLLWKGIIEDLFEDFLYFFFHGFADEVDFKQPVDFLDKELKKLYPESNSQNRRADLLVKVHLKNGEAQLLLIHIEVQGYVDLTFPERMFTYLYRSRDKFHLPIVAVAILTDDNPDYRPDAYEYIMWNTKLHYKFPIYKLLDHSVEEYEQSKNPFAAVMQTARSFLLNHQIKTDEDKLKLKVQLFRNMYRKGHNKETIRRITEFIKHYVTFKKQDFYTKFENELDKITENHQTMGIRDAILLAYEERGKEEGQEIGIEKGKELGKELGEELGIIKGLKKSIAKLLAKEYSKETIMDILEVPEELIDTVIKEEGLKKSIQKLQAEQQSAAEIIQALEISEEEYQNFLKDIEKERDGKLF